MQEASAMPKPHSRDEKPSPLHDITAVCPVCGSAANYKMTMPIDAKTFRATESGRIYECSTCGVGFVFPRPIDTNAFYDLDAYYTQGASHMVRTPDGSFLERLRIHLAWRADYGEALADVISGELSKASIVDIGCGGGNLLREMSARGYQMTGVERDPASVASKAANVVKGSAEDLPPLPKFDGVVFSHVIEHLLDPVAVLRSAAELLSPGGKLFVEVPNNQSRIARQSGLSWEHLDVPRHINFFGEESLKKLAERAGLKVERAYFSGYCRYFSDSFVATEQRIHDRLAGAMPSVRNSRWLAWKLLARTALAKAGDKYDSVGIIATRATG